MRNRGRRLRSRGVEPGGRLRSRGVNRGASSVPEVWNRGAPRSRGVERALPADWKAHTAAFGAERKTEVDAPTEIVPPWLGWPSKAAGRGLPT